MDVYRKIIMLVVEVIHGAELIITRDIIPKQFYGLKTSILPSTRNGTLLTDKKNFVLSSHMVRCFSV